MSDIALCKWDQASFFHCAHNHSIFLFLIESSMCDTNCWWQSFHIKSIFDWDRYTKQRMQKLINLLFRVLECPVTFVWWLSDIITMLSLFDGFFEVDLSNQIQAKTDCGCTPTVNGSELFWGDFVIVELVNYLLQWQTSDSVDGVLCDLFLSDDFLKHVETFLDSLVSLV